MQKVKDLVPNSNGSVRVRVCSQGDTRVVSSKKGYDLRVSSFLVGDETGAMEFSAFGKDIYAMSKLVGRVVEVRDGWVKEWRGRKQMSLGKSGTFEIVEDPSFPMISEIMALWDAGGDEDGSDDE